VKYSLPIAGAITLLLAIVIASPDLLLVAPHGPSEMRKANALCRMVEVAEEQLVRPVASAIADRAVSVLTLGL